MTVLHKYLPSAPSESVGGEGFLTSTLGLFVELTQGVEEARELDVTEHVAGSADTLMWYEISPCLQVVPIFADVSA